MVVGGGSPVWAGSGCDESFHVIGSPSVAAGETQLSNVTGWNASNAWAIGTGNGAGLSIHWNGTVWSKVAFPVIGQQSLPFAVAMAGAHDVWSFGQFKNSLGTFRSLALHKTGGAWVKVPTPNLGKGENALYVASVIAPNDIWAAGIGTGGGVVRGLVAHWNGIKWKRIGLPVIGDGDNYVEGLTTVGPGDVWVAVTYLDTDSGDDLAATYHRVAGVWHGVDFPQPGDGSVEPRDMLAFGPSAIWMVGFFSDGSTEHGLLERWNGSHWVRFAGVNPDPTTFLERVTGFGPHDVYAVGGAGAGTFVEHFNGNVWKRVGTHDPAGAETGVFYGGGSASTGSDHHVWGVGFTQASGGPRQSLVEESCPP
jgi:hypothetical protein